MHLIFRKPISKVPNVKRVWPKAILRWVTDRKVFLVLGCVWLRTKCTQKTRVGLRACSSAQKRFFFLSFWLVRWPRLIPFDEMRFYCLERKLGKTVSFGRWKRWDKCNLLKGERRSIVLNWVRPTNREHRRSSCSLTRPAHTHHELVRRGIRGKKSICIFPPRTRTEFTTDQEQYTMRTIFGQFHTSMHGRRQGPELHSLQLVSTDDGF